MDTDELVTPFTKKDDSWSWKTEFIGKWMLGAIDSYRYTGDKALLDKISDAAHKLIATAQEDGYIGNYTPEARMKAWDIWGRKYTALAMVSFYRLTGEKTALDAAASSIRCLMRELREADAEIGLTGNYKGMPSCSILEPVVAIYKETRDQDFLDFALDIVRSLEKDGSSQLITKALAVVPVSERSAFPQNWWSFDNGMKAYEMMSCYEGIYELGRLTSNPSYILAVEKAIDSIIVDEINIAGSGAAFECWYKGRERQTQPTYHMMETCVSFTWLQLCARMLSTTHNSRYADQFEKTMYNALMASMKHDGSQISKYCPLEGYRYEGEHQCGLHINCCNANGPRGFALIPKTVYTLDDGSIFVNLYIPSEGEFSLGKNKFKLKQDTTYPIEGDVSISVSTISKKSSEFTVALRVPVWNGGKFDVKVNGQKAELNTRDGYAYIKRKWSDGDRIEVSMNLQTRLERLNNCQAVTRGPIVFARDSRFADGDVDVAAVIQADATGVIDAKPSYGTFSFLELKVPMVVGTNLEDNEDKAVRMISFCDFASAGNDWNKLGRLRVWIPQTLHVMSEPYHKY